MLKFLFLLLMLTVSESSNEAVNFPLVSEPFTITISLAQYNISDDEPVESFYQVRPDSKVRIIVTKIPEGTEFVLIQVHSHLRNVSLSYDETEHESNSITGTNVGLLKMYEKKNMVFFLTNNGHSDAHIMVVIQPYTAGSPIPGGCNMEFPVEISPFLRTTFNGETTQVDFAPAAPPSTHPVLPGDRCNIEPHLIKHEVYYQYFPERDFTKETYFHILQSMLTRNRILRNGILTSPKFSLSPMRRIFAAYPGTGSVFVAMTHFMDRTSVYVPSVSYDCFDGDENGMCHVLPSVFSKIFCAFLLFIGLFTCVFGHYFFKAEMFLFGYFFSGLITYVVCNILLNTSLSFTVSLLVGFFISSNVFFGWSIFEIPIISLLLATLTLGFLLACIVFYFLVDFVNLFVIDLNYWGVFIGIVLTCPFIMLCLAEKANMTACSLIGSYVAIMSVDHYLGSNMRYIFLNVVRRATQEKFRYAIIGPPYQWKDSVLSLSWFFLTLFGVILQVLLMRKRAPYPPPRDLHECTSLLGNSSQNQSFFSAKVTLYTNRTSFGGFFHPFSHRLFY